MKENPRKVSKSAIKSENALNEKEDFIMLPTVDFCFKELMQNENVRKGIIAAILNKRPDEIVNTELLPTILRKDSEDDKYGILDVRVQLDNEVQIDFEMQVVYYDFWANRTIYYLSKMYTEQIREGDSYDRLQKCIQVSILAHVLFQEDDECYRRISFCDVKTGKEDVYKRQVLSSMRTMMLCVRYGAMTTASAAVYLLQRQVKRCSSSELVQTLLSVFFTLSTVVSMLSLIHI